MFMYGSEWVSEWVSISSSLGAITPETHGQGASPQGNIPLTQDTEGFKFWTRGLQYYAMGVPCSSIRTSRCVVCVSVCILMHTQACTCEHTFFLHDKT